MKNYMRETFASALTTGMIAIGCGGEAERLDGVKVTLKADLPGGTIPAGSQGVPLLALHFENQTVDYKARIQSITFQKDPRVGDAEPVEGVAAVTDDVLRRFSPVFDLTQEPSAKITAHNIAFEDDTTLPVGEVPILDVVLSATFPKSATGGRIGYIIENPEEDIVVVNEEGERVHLTIDSSLTQFALPEIFSIGEPDPWELTIVRNAEDRIYPAGAEGPYILADMYVITSEWMWDALNDDSWPHEDYPQLYSLHLKVGGSCPAESIARDGYFNHISFYEPWVNRTYDTVDQVSRDGFLHFTISYGGLIDPVPLYTQDKNKLLDLPIYQIRSDRPCPSGTTLTLSEEVAEFDSHITYNSGPEGYDEKGIGIQSRFDPGLVFTTTFE